VAQARLFQLWLKTVLLLTLLSILGTPALGAVSPPSVTPSRGVGYFRPYSHAALVGRVVALPAPAMRLTIQLLLKGRHLNEIARLVRSQTDPNSPLYHRWLTPAQYGTYFGASLQDVRQVIGVLRSQGFTVTTIAPNQRFLAAVAPVSRVESLINCNAPRW